jgi:hypothetical protein
VLWPSVGSLAKVGELGKYFFRAKHHRFTQVVKKNQKKSKKKVFFMLLPTFGTLANPQLWSWSLKLFWFFINSS